MRSTHNFQEDGKMQQAVIKSISLATVAAIIEQSTEQQHLDTGSSYVSIHIHPTFGRVTLMTNSMDEAGIAIVSSQYADNLTA